MKKHHQSSFQTVILDDPSFPDLILNSLRLNDKDIRQKTISTLSSIVIVFPWMKEQFMTANLVGRMLETVDFVSLPLSESDTLFYHIGFIWRIFHQKGDDEETRFKQYRLCRVSVFEPAKQFLIFIFHTSDKLILKEEDKSELENCLCQIHHHIKNMELRSDEHDADFVSELVKWEMRTMVEMENEEHFEGVFQSMLNSTYKWNRAKPEWQKRREVRLREEGWDDAFEQRVVGIEHIFSGMLKCQSSALFSKVPLSFDSQKTQPNKPASHDENDERPSSLNPPNPTHSPPFAVLASDEASLKEEKEEKKWRGEGVSCIVSSDGMGVRHKEYMCWEANELSNEPSMHSNPSSSSFAGNDTALMGKRDGTVDNAVLEMEGDEERDRVELESDMNQSKIDRRCLVDIVNSPIQLSDASTDSHPSSLVALGD
ncbi:hypothetical protein BLNAU_3909 [Blattamonas nauphoetae]|uniref:Uncharacterized protein n=1 Tax=Blattamonas nauphoetae TaxID=2049346 RepID=A0ABQ9YBI9_9EUKA|nr:hypothetical protein BLNAU_3909 [Blattamonas nauphoetae]